MDPEDNNLSGQDPNPDATNTPLPDGVTPPVTDPPPAADTSIEEDPIVGSMISQLLGKEEKQDDIKPAEDEVPSSEPDLKEDEPAPKPTEDDDGNGLKVLPARKSIQEQIQEEVAKQQKSAQQQSTAANHPPNEAPKPPETPSSEVSPAALENLSEDEQDYYDLLRYAAQEKGDQYQGELDKFVAFANKRNRLRDSILENDPDADLSEHEAFQRFTERSRPTLPRREIKAIERMQVVAEAEKQIKAQYDDKFQSLEKETKQANLEPVVNKQSAEFEAGLLAASKDPARFEGDETIPNIISVIEKEGAAAAQEANPLFSGIVSSSVSQHAEAAKEFVRLTKMGEQGINVYDDKNPTHQWLLEFINQNDARFLQSNTPKKIRNIDSVSKNFATQQSFSQMSPEEQSRHWTFSTEERLRMIQANAILHMKKSVTDLRDKLKKSGWTQQQINKQLGSQSQKSDNKTPSPKVKQSLSTGANPNPKTTQAESAMSKSELAALGFG